MTPATPHNSRVTLHYLLPLFRIIIKLFDNKFHISYSYHPRNAELVNFGVTSKKLPVKLKNTIRMRGEHTRLRSQL